jgi:hypothetical protein
MFASGRAEHGPFLLFLQVDCLRNASRANNRVRSVQHFESRVAFILLIDFSDVKFFQLVTKPLVAKHSRGDSLITKFVQNWLLKHILCLLNGDLRVPNRQERIIAYTTQVVF